ncbi:MAG TPA: hypothetical protein VGM82_21045 [Gemmatimonadaceae bacterium]|jgi:hypothetical protein
MRPWLYFGVVAASCLFVACNERLNAASADKPVVDTTHAPATMIDSALPMAVLIDRFRRDLPRVDSLRGGATSRDELVKRVVAAMASNDTAALTHVTVSLGEYAWLYFPTTKVAQPPYEVPPGLAWFQVQEKNRRGALRAFRELGGHRITMKGYRCDESPTVEAQNRLWTGCAVSISRDGKAVELKLFGAILERDGRFEVLSYQNAF